MRYLSGKNAILTGGSKGIGRYIAQALAREGVNIALVARSAEQLGPVAQEVTKLGIRAVAIPADITIESERITLLQRAIEELGQIDILINNAGIVKWTQFLRQEEREMFRLIETNLLAPMFLTQEVLPDMLERGYGHIINISSLAGKRGVPYQATYAASKAGLIEWSNALRMELEDTGVGVSVICPGYISEVGMFAIHGQSVPLLVGSVSPRRVAETVIRTIKKNPQEVLVGPGPTRILYVLNELSPGIGTFLLKVMGVKKLQQKLADDEY